MNVPGKIKSIQIFSHGIKKCSVLLIVKVVEELMRIRLLKTFIFMVALKLTRVALEPGAQST